jgi:autotransporter adhesin
VSTSLSTLDFEFSQAACGPNQPQDGLECGAGATAGTGGTALGNGAHAGIDSVAVGTNAYAAGPYDTAVGYGATVNADHGTALGANATVNAVGGTAIGAGATVAAGATNAVAIGANSVATQPNTVSFGGGAAGDRRLTNVAPGRDNTDAANFGQVRKAYSGVAMAFAQTAISPTLATGEQSVTLGGGVFESQGGFALKYEARPADKWFLGAAVSVGTDSEWGGSAGVGFKW